MLLAARAALIVITGVCLCAAPAGAQRRGPPGRGPGGPRLDPAMVDPIVRDGPPTRERVNRLVKLTDAEGTDYETERQAVLAETASIRDSVQKAPPAASMPFEGGPRGGVGMDRETYEMLERLHRQRKELVGAQERLDEWLKKTIGKDRYKPYDEWRTEQREAAMAGLRQELLRRMREEGGGYAP